MEQLPYFPFYVNDWLTGQATTRMTAEQKGAFIDLLAHAWNSKPPCTLADDAGEFAKLSGLGARWKKVGDKVRAQFVPAGEGLVMNPKQMQVYQEVFNFRESKAAAGRQGGLAKAAARLAESQQKPSTASSTVGGKVGSTESSKSYPSSSSSSSEQKKRSLSPIDPEDPGEKAARFLDRYPAIYAKVRHGAHYLVKPARDHHYAIQLVIGWPDRSRLDLMAEVFLRMSAKEANNIPGTPGQFLHMAPECDARLRENGR